MATIVKLTGTVIKSKNRGKKMGFPTANIILDKNIPEGIYLSQTKIKGKLYNSLTFIGAARTFDEEEINAEIFILDFDNDIYNESIEVSLIKKIRNNEKFETEKALVMQMEKDKKFAINYFNKHSQ